MRSKYSGAVIGGTGPISATLLPPEDDPPFGPSVKSQTLPDTSAASPVGPAAACACASVGKLSIRQNKGPGGNCWTFFSATGESPISATQRNVPMGQIQTSKPGRVNRTQSLRPVLLRSEASDPSKSACFLLVMVGWRPTYAASSFDSATSENRQSAADMKYRHTLRNCAGDRRVIDTAYELATREPSACRRDRFSDGEPATLCRGSVHAIK